MHPPTEARSELQPTLNIEGKKETKYQVYTEYNHEEWCLLGCYAVWLL
jgi:hypothetical protein